MLRRQHLLLSTKGLDLAKIFYRRGDLKQRSAVDRGAPQYYEQGDTSFDSRVKHSTVIANQLAAASAVRREKSREEASSEIIGHFYKNENDGNNNKSQKQTLKGMINRARELSTYANPQNESERQYLEDEFGRELQLRDRTKGRQFSQYDSYKERNQDPRNKNNNKNSNSKLAHLPNGLNPSIGPEQKIRNSMRGDERNENAPLPYTRELHKTQTRRELTRLENQMKFSTTGLEPSAADYNYALRALGREDALDEEVTQLQEKLIDECGLYPSQRLDAYMLQDDSMFPSWVNDLQPALKDRVRYGGIGLTDDDEVLRQNLARMPIEEREEEWLRLKSARAERMGSAERRLSPAEIRQTRLGIRRNHQLHKKRLRRAVLMKQLVQRKPEKHEVWPAGQIDYSSRLATVARFVEAGVPTKGQWPLDQRQLSNEVRKKMIAEEAQKEFINAGVALSSSRPSADGVALNKNMQRVMARIEDKQRSVKRISKKKFAQRLVAIHLGSKDEHGRKFHKMEQWKKQTRITNYRSEEEMKMNKELLPLVSPDDSFNAMRVHQGKGHSMHKGQWDGYHPYAEERRRHGIPNTEEQF